MRVIELLRDPSVDVAILQLLHEHVLGDSRMVGGTGAGVQVPRDAEFLPLANKLVVIAVDDVLGSHPFFISPNGDWGAVHVGAAHHEHLVADSSLEAGKDVGGQVCASKVANVA